MNSQLLMSVSFVAQQSCKKGVEHIRLVVLKIAFREIKQNPQNRAYQSEIMRSPTLVQTTSTYIGKQNGQEIQQQQREEFEQESKKSKQLTFLQSKVRSSTTPQQDALHSNDNDEILDNEMSENLSEQQKEITKIQKKSFSQHKDLQQEYLTHRTIDHPYLKFGDIFVIKTSVSSTTQHETQQYELIIIGNLQYSGSINCVNMQNQVINNPYSNQQKCFFTIKNPRTIKNDQSYVCYGQRIVLVHTKSEQNIIINLDMPAQERGSFQVNLQSSIGHQNILRIMPNSSAKNIGDKIQYTDQILFQLDSNRQYYLKLEKDESRYSTNRFIDINASDKPQNFHLHKVKTHQNQIVQLIHQQSQIAIGTSEKQLQQFITNKTAQINNFNNEQQQQQQENFSLRTLDLNKYLIQDYEVLSTNHLNSYTYFEIQPIFPFTEQQAHPNACKLKSLFTQQYLSIDPSDEKKLKLTSGFMSDENTIFYLTPEQPEQQDNQGQVVSIQSQLGTFLSVTQNSKLQFQSCTNQSPQLFTQKIIPQNISNILEDLNEIQMRILNFHVYLQQWSIISDKRKQDDILVFDYLKSLSQKSQLEQEVQHLELQLDLLSNHLNSKPNQYDISNNNQTNYIQKQKVVREQKILELLFSLLKLIDNIVFTSQKVFREKDKSRLYKIDRALPPQQSASYIAFKVLASIPAQIYKIILLSIKNNHSNRKIALDNDEFLCQQIRSYGPQVASILREAVRDQQNIDLSDWVRLLEPLDEVGNNIYDMTIYLKIISIAMVDSNNQGIIRYQNKVCKELFSQGKNGKTKFLCQYNNLLDQPTFDLYREESFDAFKIKNPSLQSLSSIRLSESNEMIVFSLQDLGQKVIVKKSLVQFLSYLTASVNFLAQLCKGRNKKCMKKVQFLGITSSHIQYVIKSTVIPQSMKNSYLKLYEVLYIDIDPFLPIESQTCFIWGQLSIEKDKKIAQLFNHYVEAVEVGKLTKEFEEKMLPLLTELLNQGNSFQEGLIKAKKKKPNLNPINRLPTLSGSGAQEKVEQKSKVSQKIKFLTTLYHLIYKIIQLGYLTEFQICQSVEPMLQIFIPFLTVKEKQLLEVKENWLNELISSAKNMQQQGLLDLIDDLFYNAGLLFRQYFIIQLNVQTLEFIRHFQKSYQGYCLQSLEKLVSEVREIITIMQLGEKKNLVLGYLLGFYCSNFLFQSKGFKLCQDALNQGVNQQWIQKLKQVEIILEGEELELYQQLTGNSLVGQIFSPTRLEVQIQQLEDQQRKGQEGGKQKEEKNWEIDNQLNKLINRIKEIKMDRFKLRKTQNILRNLGVHKQILRLIKAQKECNDTQQISIKFLCLFVINNKQNCYEIQDEMLGLIRLTSMNLKVSKLLGIICQNMNERYAFIQQLMKQIFSTMHEFRPTCQQFYYTLLSILQIKWLTADKMIALKREILSNLFKVPSYINDLQYFKSFSEIKNKKEEQQFYGPDFKVFSAANSVTAQLIKDYDLGVQQVQGILFTEQINLRNSWSMRMKQQNDFQPEINQLFFQISNASYLIKAELIKLLYTTQIQSIHTFTMQDMRELLLILLNDLLIFPKYLDGLFKNYQTNTEDEKENTLKDKQQIEFVKSKVFNDQSTPIQNSASQQANEQKKIIIDNTEYWKYIMTISNWQNIQFGVVVFLQQLFYEIQIRKWNISDVSQKQEFNQNEQMNQIIEDSLFEPLFLIKSILEYMRQALNLIEQSISYPKNRVYLAQIQYYISKCLMSLPLTLKQKEFKPIKYIIEDKISRQIKQQVREFKIKTYPNLQQEEVKQNLNSFYEKIRKYMLTKHLTISEIMDKIKGDNVVFQELLIQEGQYIVEGQEKQVSKDKFCCLFQPILEEHFQILIEIKLSKILPDISEYLTYEDASRYFDSYMQIRDTNKNTLDLNINKFYSKLINYFDSQKFKYNKQELKELQKNKVKIKTQKQQSLFIQQTYNQFIYQYDLLINPDNNYNFYRLDKVIFDELQEQFLLRLSNDEEIAYTFQRLLKEEAVQQRYLALNILNECLLREQIIVEKDKLLQFSIKQLPVLMIYLEDSDNEYTLQSIKKVKMTLSIMEEVQSIDEQLLATVFQNECYSSYQKFISRIFNQVDRLLNLENHSKQSNKQEGNGIFLSKVDMQNEKNQLLDQYFKIIMQILKFIGKLIQNIDSNSSFGDQTNLLGLIEEVLYFMTNYFNYINRSQLTNICTETDILSIYIECLKCLNNFCEGNIQNQNLIFSHKPLVSIIQFVITTQKYDILADNLQDNKYRILFKTTIQLLLQVKIDTHQIYSELNFQILFEKLLAIYDSLVPRISFVIQGQKCTHTENINCTYLKCEQHLIAPGEFEIFIICFDLIILFNILSENIHNIGNQEKKKNYWQTLRDRVVHDQQNELSMNQKQNINFLRVYISMKQFVKQQPFDGKRQEQLKEYLNQNDTIISSLDIKDTKNQQKINIKKKPTPLKSPLVVKKQPSLFENNASPKSKMNRSVYKITNKKSFVQQSLDEAIPFKKLEEQDAVVETFGGKRESKIEQKFEEIAINWLENTQQNNQRDIMKKNLCFKMAEAINFFSKYVGQIQIQINGENKLQYFILPFQSSFLLKQTTKKAKQLRMRRGRYDQLKTMSDYFQNEVIFRQRISMYPKLNWLSVNIHLLKILNYLIVLALNICYLADLERQNNQIDFKNSITRILVIVLTILLILSSCIVLIVEIINQQPYITFRVNYYKDQLYEDNELNFKDNESVNYLNHNALRPKKETLKKKIKVHQYLNQNRVLAQLSNLTFLYDLIYLIIAALSFLASPFISLLLFDIISRIKSLRKVLQSVLVNFWKILLILYLTLIVIHCYSFLAFVVVDDEALQKNNTESFDFITIFLLFFGNSFRLENAIGNPDIYPNQQWGNYIFIVTLYMVVFVICFAVIISIISGQYSRNNALLKNQKNKSCKICGITYYQCRDLNMDWQEHIEKVHKLSYYLFFLICLQQKQELNYVERGIAKKLQEKDVSWLPKLR